MLITDQTKIKLYYKALLDREQSYAGIFYVGVKTTSVFCIATCRARKPKFENVEFYTSVKGALDAGYRPCKVCKPTENANEAPPIVSRTIQMVRDNPKAVRAVASANGFNRISIIVPCHRVIGKDGQLTGYGGGLERKRWLINHEKNYS